MSHENKIINPGLMRKRSLQNTLLRKVVYGFVVWLRVVFLFAFCSSSIAVNEDYAAYAREHGQKAKEVIAPYKAEVDEIIKNVSIRQAQTDIQSFKEEITNIAKTQCSPQYQGANASTITTAAAQPEAVSTPVIVFISFSMPKESIREWMSQARKVGASVYIRGLVNNSFKETTKAVLELVQDQPGGLLIDPTLFKKYSIVQVPAVVIASDNNIDVIYGDVTLDVALEKISKSMQEIVPKYLVDAIKKLRSKNVAELNKKQDKGNKRQ
jgi:type-F conjugative transfer system pilin assembly protein TrbC